MRRASEITARTHEHIRPLIQVGVASDEIDRAAEAFIRSQDAIPAFKGLYGFPKTCCISFNEQIVHGIPGERRIRDGDIVTIDLGVKYKGYHGDCAMSYGVGAVNERATRILKHCRAALERSIEAVAPGVPVWRIAQVIQDYAESRRYSVVREYTGHGIGTELHEAPAILNFVDRETPEQRMLLRPGMAICIEPMLCEGTWKTKRMRDDWTVVTKDRKLSCHFEHTILVTPDGHEVLTRFPGEPYYEPPAESAAAPSEAAARASAP